VEIFHTLPVYFLRERGGGGSRKSKSEKVKFGRMCSSDKCYSPERGIGHGWKSERLKEKKKKEPSREKCADCKKKKESINRSEHIWEDLGLLEGGEEPPNRCQQGKEKVGGNGENTKRKGGEGRYRWPLSKKTKITHSN